MLLHLGTISLSPSYILPCHIIFSQIISSRKAKSCLDHIWKCIPWWNEVNNLPLSLYLEAYSFAFAKEKGFDLHLKFVYQISLPPSFQYLWGFNLLSMGQVCYRFQFSQIQENRSLSSKWKKWVWGFFLISKLSLFYWIVQGKECTWNTDHYYYYLEFIK